MPGTLIIKQVTCAPSEIVQGFWKYLLEELAGLLQNYEVFVTEVSI